jgi:hypothetical protein
MGSRWMGSVIVLFWLSTMTWLVESKVLPPLRRGEPPDYRSMYSDDPFDEDPVGWDMMLNGKPIGWAVSRLAKFANGLSRAYHTTNLRSQIHFDRIPVQDLSPAWMKALWHATSEPSDEMKMDAFSELTIDSLGHLAKFRSSLRVAGMRDSIKINGEVYASLLKITVEAGQFRDRFETYLPSDALVADELSPQSRMTGLHVGQEWTVPVFSPLRPPNTPIEILQARVEKSDPLVWEEGTVPVCQVVYRSDSGSEMSSSREPRAKLWINSKGEVLRQEVSVLGSKLVFARMSTLRSADLAAAADEAEQQRQRDWHRH